MSLTGKTVVVTRGPERAEALLEALSSHRARGWLLPVIDFETPADTAPVDEALRSLQQGHFDWLVITSATTVRALGLRAVAERVDGQGLDGQDLDRSGLGRTGLGRLVPPGTRVAAVGPAAARALEAEGIRVDLVPDTEQSAQGLLRSLAASFNAGRSRTSESAADAPTGPMIFLPQADIAEPALREGLGGLGARVVAVNAYCTVNYPADPERRLFDPRSEAAPRSEADPRSEAAPRSEAGAPVVLTPADFRRELEQGKVDALVFTSPSAVRRVHAEAGKLTEPVRVITIGRPTAEQAAALGLQVAAVAPEPTPAGIVAALEKVFANAPAQPDENLDRTRRRFSAQVSDSKRRL